MVRLTAWGLACAPFAAPEVTVADDPVTFARATWPDDHGERTRVVVSQGDAPFLQTDWQAPGSTHEADLLGLWAGSDWVARVEGEGGGGSDPVPFSTAGLPAAFPTWNSWGEAGYSGVLATSLLAGTPWAVVLDESGSPVWYQEAPSPLLVLRARLRRDGRGVVYARTWDSDVGGDPSLVWANWDGTIARVLKLPGYTHDFVEMEDGTLIVVRNDTRTVDDYEQPVWGNDVAEVGTDGTVRVLWSTWDEWVPGVDGEVQDNGFWTHANALDLDVDEAEITLGMRDLSQIIRIDRASGERSWQFGGSGSDYVIAAGSTAPHEQHQFQWVDEELLLFDNRESDEGSRVVQYAFDDASGRASESWAWQHDPALWSYVLGDVDRLDDGGTLATFSTAGVISDIGPDGEVRWELETRFSVILGFVERADALPGVTRLR